MITRRALIFALCFVLTCVRAQFSPLSSAGDDNDCALYLTGPGRSSAFDYNLNLLKGSFQYEGQHTCITYDAVNAAYIDARKRINVATPKGDWKTEDIASVGELMLDISISLARTYGLTYEDIEKGLPLIDTSKTLIREVCPPFLSHVECRAGKYRRFDGLCTNLQHPTWGASMTPFQRLIAPLYADGINAPRVSVTGRDLPLSRVVSRTMHPDEGFHDHAGTVMVIAWGQFMDHDYTLTGTPLDPLNRNDPEECCHRPPHRKHPYCNELRIPDDDYFYRLFNVKCIDFVRGFPSPRAGCRLGSRQQFNTLTGVLDGNTVYGVSEKFARKLRSGVAGLLRMNPVFEEYGLKDLLPLKLDIPDEGCTRPNKSMYCFEAGEIRVNEQLVLTCMHTLMAREHNRVARGLAEVNPHWDDETLFQESRRIVIAEIQHITYNEFLPILLGKEVMEKFGLLLQKDGYWDGYDENVNPSVIDAFSAAAFRFGHSLLPTAVERWSKAHKFIASKRLSDLIRRPFDLYRAGIFDEYLMGLMNQVAQAMDDSITQEVTNHLFKKPGARFGMDLVSFNMQRGREFGLPGYMEFRKFCGLPGANSFQELFGSMPNETIQRYESIFDHPSDVDLWSGGVSERPLPGSMLGPTFACVIATQFSYSRRGDRFWYELPNQPSSFTPEQLTELKKARLARIICDNTDIIDTVQVYPMVLPDHEINPRVPCRSGVIPSIDFTKWADYSGNLHIPTNPYERETQASFTKSTPYDYKKKNVTEVAQKSTGHYKNALRRKKRDTYENLKVKKNNVTNDSQAAAVLVTQVTGSHQENENIATTEAIIPKDQRDETAPQTFTPKTENVETINDYESDYQYDDDEQVSQEEPLENLKNANEDLIEYTDNRFIPDEEENSNIENEEREKEEITDEHDEHGSEENNSNQKFSGKQNLGLDESTEKRSYISDKSADESDHLNEGPQDACVPARRRSGNSNADGAGRNSKLVKRDCEVRGEGVEWVDESTRDSDVATDNDETTNINDNLEAEKTSEQSENAKEQFEHIPLNYKHDNTQEKQNENVQNKVKKGYLYADLGDTTVVIDDIKLPEIVFGTYDNEYFDRLRAKNNNDYDADYKDTEDDYEDTEENNDDEEPKENSENDDTTEESTNKQDVSEEESTENQENDTKSKTQDSTDEDYEYDPGYADFETSDDKEDHNIGDASLKEAVKSIAGKTKKTEEIIGKDGNYYWTLEYGQPIH